MSVIHLRAISKEFGRVVAVDNVDMEVKDGEFMTILGPSGSGKTTILSMIAGFEAPTRGTIEIGNIDVTNDPPHKRDVGLVFQSYALFPHLTVFNNVAFPLKVRKVPKSEIEMKVNKVLELVRLEKFGNRKPNELSGGQQQRVALARAFVFEPSILLLDEPLAALDRKLRQQVQVEIKELQRSLGITTITVTHDQEEALTMSDRMLILNNGKIEQLGTPEELYSKPKSRFVADFLGMANFFDGIIESSNGNVYLTVKNGNKIELDEQYESSSGQYVSLLVRPEQFKMATPDAEKGHSGKIISSVYLGNEYRYQVESELGTKVIMTEAGNECRWRIGDNITFTWDERDQRVLFK
ncbi:ABC transporter ATP-binding protein [Pueribacillus sp. YX66]|uniref:ABC transporter ATP-binding protein n=1 Tax=Pueribacillus sp. YX66 TaxID=3229242 RepID=UPI00358D6C06